MGAAQCTALGGGAGGALVKAVLTLPPWCSRRPRKGLRKAGACLRCGLLKAIATSPFYLSAVCKEPGGPCEERESPARLEGHPKVPSTLMTTVPELFAPGGN